MPQAPNPQDYPPGIGGAIKLAFSWPVVRRALGFCVVVGSVLILINHFECCIVQHSPRSTCLMKMILTACVPYVVSTVSSVLAIRHACPLSSPSEDRQA
ncbi:MAG TPA: hypothetical protein DCG12_17355 [Planctomycetaceae bacterium]|nr:hypothetical protein [Planctomycetaceae bacterium]